MLIDINNKENINFNNKKSNTQMQQQENGKRVFGTQLPIEEDIDPDEFNIDDSYHSNEEMNHDLNKLEIDGNNNYHWNINEPGYVCLFLFKF
jgi:hypothetical protein